MPDLLRTNDAVLLSYAQALLRDAGIAFFLADQNMSIMEGSIGVFPRRLQVRPEDWSAARQLLIDAGLVGQLTSDGNKSGKTDD